jgi:hypothetical protein
VQEDVFQTRLSRIHRNGCSQKKGGVMLKSGLVILFAMASLILAGPYQVWAQHGHGATHGAMPTQDVLVDGVVVGFAVMSNKDHKKMLAQMKMKDDIEPGSTHNVTITIKDQQTQHPVTGASVGVRVVAPSGKDQVKAMKFEPSMNSYDAYFNMPEKGRYQILVLVREGDQKKTAGIYYDVH